MIENPRLDLLIARHRRSLLVVLVAIAVLGLAATGWAVAMPGTSTTTEETDRETVTSETTTSAVVVEDGLWESGTELEESSVYVLPAMPELTLTTATAVPADETEVTHELQVRHEAVRDESVFWEKTAAQSRSEVSIEDDVARSTSTVDVEALRDRRAELDAEFDGVGTVRTVVEVTVEYETDTHADQHVLSTPLEITEEAYWLEESPSESTEHSTTAQVDVQDSPNPVTVGGLSTMTILALVGAAFVVARSPIDAETARRSIHEHRYAEWISTGSIPMWVGDYHVALDSLEDVVDVAIDTNERVVHDEQRELFAVVNGAVVYYYAERGQWEKTAWPELELGNGPSVVDGFDDASTPPADDAIETELPDPDADDAWEQI